MSILKSKAFDDNLRQEYAKNPSDLISYKKYKALVQRVIIHLAKGTSPSPFSFKYNDDNERAEVSKYLTYLLSKEFDEETQEHYNNNEKINTMYTYDRFKESCSISVLLMVFHIIKSNRPKETKLKKNKTNTE